MRVYPTSELMGQVVAALGVARVELPRLRVVLDPGLTVSWVAAHCCQELRVASQRPVGAILDAVLEGLTAMVQHVGRRSGVSGCRGVGRVDLFGGRRER